MERPATAHQSPATRQGNSRVLHWVGALSSIVSQLEWAGHKEIINSSTEEDSDRGERANSRSQPWLPLSLLSNYCIAVPAVSVPPRATVRPRAARKMPGGFQCAEVRSAWHSPGTRGSHWVCSPPPRKGSYWSPSQKGHVYPGKE